MMNHRIRRGFHSLFFACLFSAFSAVLLHARPTNLASQAKISVSGAYSDEYSAQFLADGKIPDAQCKEDRNLAWCIPQAQSAGAQVQFSWPEPQPLREIVYYGRTAWLWDENFRRYQVFLGTSTTPAVEGMLQPGHGPQRITLPENTEEASLVIRFLDNYGGPNPGASEIRVYAQSPAPGDLGTFSAPPPAPEPPKDPLFYEANGAELPGESPELQRRVARGELGFNEILTVQRRMINASHVYTYHFEGFGPGGGLFRFRPAEEGAGQLTRLFDAGNGQILDCDLSYDGQEVLFSYRKDGNANYQLMRIGIDGTGLRPVTNHPASHNFNGAWLPDGDVVFLSTRKSSFAYCWNAPVGILYRARADGSNVRRISANYLNDFTPGVLPDGRLIYGRWEYVDRPAIPIQGLWTISPDGTGLRTFYGNRVIDPGSFLNPQAIPGTNSVLCLLTSHNGPALGAIGRVDPAHGVNAQASLTNLTPEVSIGRVDSPDRQGNHILSQNWTQPLYATPYPIDDQYFLTTRAGAMVIRDYSGQQQVALLQPSNGMGFYDSRPIRPRKRPPVMASAPILGPEFKTAFVYLQDVYDGLRPYVQPGQIKRIRVVQELEKPVCVSPQYRAFGWQFPIVSCGATYAPKKVWGEVPVDEKGSAYFEVPAGVPVYFMALDAEGRALQRMRSFTHLMPGEIQGCIGCHENRTGAAPMKPRPGVLQQPPLPLEPPEWGLRGFSFAHIVQPVLDRHCVECHDPRSPAGGLDLSGDRTQFFSVAYEQLARMETPAEQANRGDADSSEFHNPYTSWIPTYNGSEEDILEITPGAWGSPASRLADIVMSGHPDENQEPRIRLSPEERKRIYAWIDLNVPYYGTSDSNRLDVQGCRFIESGFNGPVFEDVASRRCAECHEGGQVPRRFFERITAPENSPLLLAPLAEAAGGTEKCGRPVFVDTQDPDYLALLAEAKKVEAYLAANPRKDTQAEY